MPDLFCTSHTSPCCSYVQELEQRLVQMESLLTQVAPVVELLGQSPNGGIMLPNGTQVAAPTSQMSTPQTGPIQLPVDLNSSNMPLASGSRFTPESDEDHNACGILKAVPREDAENDDVVDKFGQLTLDDNGHLRWIGGSSTMALMQSFRDIFANRPQRPVGSSPDSDDGDSSRPDINMLYFPVGLGFGHVHALPGVHEVEWPPRDLADKLVSKSTLHPLATPMTNRRPYPRFLVPRVPED